MNIGEDCTFVLIAENIYTVNCRNSWVIKHFSHFLQIVLIQLLRTRGGAEVHIRKKEKEKRKIPSHLPENRTKNSH